MLTRAISLLIIVGNHEALNSNENWAELITTCIKNKALVRNGKILYPRIEAP